METGTIFKFHNDLDTDQIIASQYLLLPNLDEMKGHAFESLDPDFSKKVKSGDFVVGGENWSRRATLSWQIRTLDVVHPESRRLVY